MNGFMHLSVMFLYSQDVVKKNTLQSRIYIGIADEAGSK